eukprot:389054-Pyramimonas_sp.AAC.1
MPAVVRPEDVDAGHLPVFELACVHRLPEPSTSDLKQRVEVHACSRLNGPQHVVRTLLQELTDAELVRRQAQRRVAER